MLYEQAQLSVRNGPYCGFNSTAKQGDVNELVGEEREKEIMLWSGDVLKLTQVGMKAINSPTPTNLTPTP